MSSRDVRYTDIPKIPVLKLISVYRYDFFSHTDIPKFPVYRKTSVFRCLLGFDIRLKARESLKLSFSVNKFFEGLHGEIQ